MKMWMQFNVMHWTSLGVEAVLRHAQDTGVGVMWRTKLSPYVSGVTFVGVMGVLLLLKLIV